MAVTSQDQVTERPPGNELAGGEQEEASLSAEEHLQLYRKMVLIRVFEEACQRAFRKGQIGGYLHLYIGQEAVATGFLEMYKPGDRIITAYRDHAHALLLGADPKAIMAELFGKGSGLVKGKGGSMHLFDVDNGLMGGYGIVGGHIALGVGLAYALAYQQQPNIVQLYFGDGSINNGGFHEASNLSGLWGKNQMNPCLFILENNHYGMGTSVERATAMTELGAKFDSYGIEHETVDGMDVVAVINCARRTTARVRESGVPYAVEVNTYRTVPHGAADFIERYRSKEEVQKWRQRDPIGLLEQRYMALEGADEDALSAIRGEVEVIVADAVKFAESSPEPSLDELTTDVYAQ